jgi:hypothetical protein
MTERRAISPSAERLAHAIVLATSSPTDPRTLLAWGQHVGVSRGALRAWCVAAHVSARSSLDFLRVLRAVLLSKDRPWDLFSVLDIVDKRSVTRLLQRGGIGQLVHRTDSPSIEEFLGTQCFVRNEDVVQAVARRLPGHHS